MMNAMNAASPTLRQKGVPEYFHVLKNASIERIIPAAMRGSHDAYSREGMFNPPLGDTPGLGKRSPIIFGEGNVIRVTMSHGRAFFHVISSRIRRSAVSSPTANRTIYDAK